MADSQALAEYLQAAKEAALRAAVVLAEWRQKFSVREKGRFDLVTDADLASQKTIHEYLCGRFPGHALLGEEDAAGKGRLAADAPPTWIVDPIDGTTNYVHDYPFYLHFHRPADRGRTGRRRRLRSRASGNVRGRQGHGGLARHAPPQYQLGPNARRSPAGDGLSAQRGRATKTRCKWWQHFSFRAQSLRRTGSTALNSNT